MLHTLKKKELSAFADAAVRVIYNSNVEQDERDE